MAVTDVARTNFEIDEFRDWLNDNWDPDLTCAQWWERLGLGGWSQPIMPKSRYGQDLSRGDAIKVQRAINEHGAPVRTPRTAPPPKTKEERTGPRQFLREVRAELRKVVWPTREEVRNYSIIVLVTVVLFTAFVATLDWGLGSLVLRVYDR